MKWIAAVAAILFTCVATRAGVPAPPDASTLSDWSNSFDPAAPGMLAADSLLDAPAGNHGPIVVRDGHFYSGDRRVRFWGMNLAFGANFPTHEQADAVALRLSRFGINAVRMHHMDMRPFPDGIFADESLTTLSPQSLDRLDYFTAALKSRGIWCDINLHVSRNYASLHPETRNSKEAITKIVDLFDPMLIDSQKRYAHDLLTHVNAYTHNRYADEPSVAIVEINNENSLFMWDAREKLANLPAPYEAELREQWNHWLLDHYKSRDGLAKVWAVGAAPVGPQLLSDSNFNSPASTSPWRSEMHDESKMKVTRDQDTIVLDVTQVDSTPWHLQFLQSKLSVIAGRPYTVQFKAQASKPVKIAVSVGEAHAPWENLGLAETVALSTDQQTYDFTFIAKHNEKGARLSFSVGSAVATVRISQPLLATGGVNGLETNEDPTANTVALQGLSKSGTRARVADWYAFIEETEATYYRTMFDYVHHDLGVKCPVTGTIAFGLLPLKAQLPMDFIDAHSYWDHPQFPHRPWDQSDWLIRNEPMVDSPAANALFALGGYRVAGKPFTVMEYNHAAPNEWQAECVPMIASYAAAQDWDAVFLFAYSHSADFDKPIMEDFFNFEGNPLKMPLLPMGARIFLGGGVQPLARGLATVAQVDPAQGGLPNYADADSLLRQASITYGHRGTDAIVPLNLEPTIAWKSSGPATGTGRFTVVDSHAAVFVGFSAGEMPIDLGLLSIREMSTPFATMILTASDGHQKIDVADRLFLTTVARATNTDLQWNATRTSVGKQWGKPPEQIERVVATIQLKGRWSHVHALDPAGNPTGDDLAHDVNGVTEAHLGDLPAQAYVIDR